MLEEIRKNILNTKNRQYFLLFKLYDKDKNFIGDYTFRIKNDGNFCIVQNDMFEKGIEENPNSTFKYDRNDKFGILLFDYIISEAKNSKELFECFSLLESREKTKHLNINDIHINTYIVYQINYSHHGKKKKINLHREAIYNNLSLHYLAKEQLKFAFEKNVTGAKINFNNPNINEIVSDLKNYIDANFTRGSLLHKIALNKNNIGLIHIKTDPLIDTRLNKVFIEQLTTYEKYTQSRANSLNRNFNNYLIVRDIVNLIFKANEEEKKEGRKKMLKHLLKK